MKQVEFTIENTPANRRKLSEVAVGCMSRDDLIDFFETHVEIMYQEFDGLFQIEWEKYLE